LLAGKGAVAALGYAREIGRLHRQVAAIGPLPVPVSP
jgi:hypothetical protein